MHACGCYVVRYLSFIFGYSPPTLFIKMTVLLESVCVRSFSGINYKLVPAKENLLADVTEKSEVRFRHS